MRRIIKNICLCALPCVVSACWVDSEPESFFVPDFNIVLSYEDYGASKNYPEALELELTNTTEQFSYSFRSRVDGVAEITGIMPGHYTVNVSGQADGVSLAGFLGNLVLNLGEHPSGIEVELCKVTPSSVIFKELYYAGSPTPTGGTYRNDNFYSIVNNSAEPVDISDLYIAATEHYGGFGETGPLWPGEAVGRYTSVYLKSVWKIVDGDEPYIMEPGSTLVIATMAVGHNQDKAFNLSSPVDLSSADFEAYVPDPENKYPDYASRNMKMAFWPDHAYLWRISVFGQGMVLLKASDEEFASFEKVMLPETFQDPFESEEYWQCLKVPYSFVVDAVDLIQNGMVTNTKRFSPELDAGYATVGRTYCSESVIRKVIQVVDGRKVYKDTNNSTSDFVINPEPLSE